MLTIVNLLLPLLCIGLIGFIAARTGHFSEEHTTALARFVFNFAVPLMLLQTFAGIDLETDLPGSLLLAYYLPVLFLYFLYFFVSARASGIGRSQQTIFAFACSYGNLVLLGMPVALIVFGDRAVASVFFIIAVHTVMLFTVTTLLLELRRATGKETRSVLTSSFKGLVTNPILLGIFAGLLFGSTGAELPTVVDSLSTLMKSAVVPCSLFAVGASLAQHRISGSWIESLCVVVAKTAVLPVTVWVFSRYVFSLDPLSTAIAVFMAAQPVGVNVYIFSQNYQTGQSMVSASIVLSTILSIFSLPLLLIVLNQSLQI
ncbi:MAG: AEC family transporter [Pseudomonadota bacterium]